MQTGVRIPQQSDAKKEHSTVGAQWREVDGDLRESFQGGEVGTGSVRLGRSREAGMGARSRSQSNSLSKGRGTQGLTSSWSWGVRERGNKEGRQC